MRVPPNPARNHPRRSSAACPRTPAAGRYWSLRRLLAEVPLQVSEVSLGRTKFGLGVAESGLFFLDSLHDPRAGEGRSRHTGCVGDELECCDLVGV